MQKTGILAAVFVVGIITLLLLGLPQFAFYAFCGFSAVIFSYLFVVKEKKRTDERV